ncbi:hypothetical protein LTR36_000844 [Oleoguttula mirabilis]|uniref:Uncharacterized protein n=1 Tax=Oleoguttula mirabilis TaxID=1507867 RepID=A0AAV9J317_9PEZI|nr:hypothetical protein LTR36_000844 [Oleoguttula mirabilis]
MFSSRATLRATRALRANGPAVRRNVRFASDAAASSPPVGSNHVATSAAVSAITATAIAFGFYQYSGIRPAVQTATQTKAYIDSTVGSLKAQFKQNTPDDANEVIQALRETANKYARWLPGGKHYVDSAFNDLETIRKEHGPEVDSIVREAYGELRDASSKGMNFDALSDVWEILQKHLGRLSGLAANAGQSILENHPQLKQQFGGSFDQLKQLGDSAGPEAKKMVDQTWSDVSKILAGGFSFNTVDQIRKLVQDKQEQIKKLGEQAWGKGYEQIKPLLEKSPQVKQFVEQNIDTLKQGNISEAVSKVQSAVSSGSTQDLEKYVQQAKDKAQQATSSSSSSSFSGMSTWLNMIPGGSQILPQLQKYQQVAQQHGQEAESLAKETVGELQQILEKRSKQLEELYEKGKKDAEKK